MCGIGGVWTANGATPNTDLLEKMAGALAHRGPDDQGIEMLDQLGLVHRRLSIIDLETGHQPINDDHGRTLIMVGEIYNNPELRAKLTDYPFKTGSDVEPILPLYARDGLTCVDHLRGMYAFALYDTNTKDLILGRDPFGIKQLYYAQTPNGFAFASEPQAILATGLVTPELNRSACAEGLQLRYATGAATFFEGIQRLLPGETLRIQDGQIVERYTRAALPKGKPQTVCSEKEALANFDRVFSNSVEVHLRSDVPYGLFLSGGLDSATVLAMMTRHTSAPIRTYTVGFSGTEVHDERSQARLMADKFKTNHTEINFTEADFWRLLPRVAASMDDFVCDQAMLPTYKLAEVATQDVTVVLCGEGGDEMLAGYRRYQKARLPWWLGGRLMRTKGTFTNAGFDSPAFEGWFDGAAALRDQILARGDSRLQSALAIDCASWLPNDLLIKLDRCLMAHGLEGRTPFLDPEVAALLYPLNDRLKVRGGQGKWLLRQWLAENLPEAQPFAKKRGFTVPVDGWIKEKGARLAPLVARQPCIEDLFPTALVKDIFRCETRASAYAAWTLLFFALWHKRHIEDMPAVDDTLSYLALRAA